MLALRNRKIIFVVIVVSVIIAHHSVAQEALPSAHYKEANTKLGLPAKKEQRIVFIGTSITEYWGKSCCPNFFKTNNYINRGIAGQTTSQMLLRFQQDVINLKPAVVFIEGGTNDLARTKLTPEMITNNIISMAELAKENHIKVILTSVLPIYEYPHKPELCLPETIAETNELIKNYAHKNHIKYVDYYTTLADEKKGIKTEYSEDGIHPNLNGYGVMGPLAKTAISEEVNKK